MTDMPECPVSQSAAFPFKSEGSLRAGTEHICLLLSALCFPLRESLADQFSAAAHLPPSTKERFFLSELRTPSPEGLSGRKRGDPKLRDLGGSSPSLAKMHVQVEWRFID